MAKQAEQKTVKKDLTKILTHEFRVSYPHLFKAQAFGDAEPKYSVTMLFSKKSDMSAITRAITAAKTAKWGAKDKWPKMKYPVYLDGDDEDVYLDQKGDEKKGYKGHWVIKATAREDQRPGLVDENVEDITDQRLFYPGCYARAQVFVQAWDNKFGKGVSFYLDHVQKTRDGESFGGKKPADQVFTPINNGGMDEDESETESDEVEEDFV